VRAQRAGITGLSHAVEAAARVTDKQAEAALCFVSQFRFRVLLHFLGAAAQAYVVPSELNLFRLYPTILIL
jgi:hypothetical protein